MKWVKSDKEPMHKLLDDDGREVGVVLISVGTDGIEYWAGMTLHKFEDGRVRMQKCHPGSGYALLADAKYSVEHHVGRKSK